jgi:hypothetical protein
MKLGQGVIHRKKRKSPGRLTGEEYMRSGRDGVRYRLARDSVVWLSKGCLWGSIVIVKIFFDGEGVFEVFGVAVVVDGRLRLHLRRRREECTAQESGSQLERDHGLYERTRLWGSKMTATRLSEMDSDGEKESPSIYRIYIRPSEPRKVSRQHSCIGGDFTGSRNFTSTRFTDAFRASCMDPSCSTPPN